MELFKDNNNDPNILDLFPLKTSVNEIVISKVIVTDLLDDSIIEEARKRGVFLFVPCDNGQYCIGYDPTCDESV